MWRIFKKSKEYCSTINNLLCVGKVLWILKSFNWMPSTSSKLFPILWGTRRRIRDIFHCRSGQEHKPLSDALAIEPITLYCCLRTLHPTAQREREWICRATGFGLRFLVLLIAVFWNMVHSMASCRCGLIIGSTGPGGWFGTLPCFFFLPSQNTNFVIR